MGIKKACLSFLTVLTMFLFVSGLGQAAHLNVITSSPSWYYGQRGAGVLEEVSEGSWDEPFEETTFGHLTPTYGGNYIVSGEGEGYIQGPRADTSLNHGFSITYGNPGNNQSHVDIWQSASSSGSVYAGEMSPLTHVLITDDGWGTYGAYADSTVVQAMKIEADDGESIGDPVTVTVSSSYWWDPHLWPMDPMGWIQGIISGPAGTSGFTVFRKDSKGNILETYAYNPVTLYETSSPSPPLGYGLWDLTIDAAVGDIIEVDSAIFSQVYLDAEREADSEIYWEGDASLSFLSVPRFAGKNCSQLKEKI